MPGTITGKHILYDVSLTVNGVDLSNRVESVELKLSTNTHMASAMGDIQDYIMAGTLAIDDIAVTFYADFDAAKVYATLYAAWLARTNINIVGKASSGGNSATNPQWTVPCIVKSMNVFGANRGDRHMTPATFAAAGAYSIAVV